MAEQNSIGNKSSQLTIDPGASGDSFVQFDINTTGEYRIGVDDTDGDAFVVSQGSVLGTNNHLKITAAGECTMPLNPCFLVTGPTTIQLNLTGDGTLHQLGTSGTWNEIFDQGGDATTAILFTAPVTGRYFFENSTRYDALNSGHTSGFQQAQASNRNYKYGLANVFAMRQVSITPNNLITVGQFIVDMDAADTIRFYMQVDNGAKNCGLRGGSQSCVSGVLLN